MKALKVDFAPPHRVGLVWWIALSAALLLLSVFQATQAWETREQSKLIRAQNSELSARLQQRREAQEAALARSRTVPPYAVDAAAFAKVALFPLSQVLRAIEGVQIEGVRVTSIETDATQGTVRVEIEYRSSELLKQYVDELNEGEPAPRWRLMQARSADIAGSAVGFATLISLWNSSN